MTIIKLITLFMEHMDVVPEIILIFKGMIRKDGYKLMLFPKNKRIELYNLNDDPYEINNLADNSNYKSKVKDLYEELIILQKEMGDTLKLDMYFKNKL
jgi:arylsulfatase A-like enzyme